jgi:hypothetical protein
MNEIHIFLMKNEKKITYSLIALGVSLILVGIFFNFSWLKEIGDSFSGDNDCKFCGIFSYSEFILPLVGVMILLFAVFYLNEVITRKISNNKFYVLLGFVILIGLLLRLNLAYNTQLWLDEGESAIDSINLFETGAPRGFYRDLPINYGPVGNEINDTFFRFGHTNPDSSIYHGWLTFVFAGAMYTLFGANSFLMRLPFCFMFIISAVILFKLTKIFTARRSILFAVTLVYSLNILMISHEFQLRYYSLLTMLSILSVYVFILYWLKDCKRFFWCVCITALALQFTHIPAFIALNFAVLFVLLIEKVTNKSTEKINLKHILIYGLIQIAAFILLVLYTGDFGILTYALAYLFCDHFKLFVVLGTVAVVLVLLKMALNARNKLTFKRDILFWLKIGMLFLALFILIFWYYSIGLMLILSLIALIVAQSKNRSMLFVIVASFSFLLIANVLTGYSNFRIRNSLGCVPLLALILFYSLLLIHNDLKHKKESIFNFAIFIITLLLISPLPATANYMQELELGPGNANYLKEVFLNLMPENNSKVFVTSDYFSYLFYTNYSVFHIWNINPEYFINSKEKYYIVENPPRNGYMGKYYFNYNITLITEFNNTIRQIEREKCKPNPLKSGVIIYECN